MRTHDPHTSVSEKGLLIVSDQLLPLPTPRPIMQSKVGIRTYSLTVSCESSHESFSRDPDKRKNLIQNPRSESVKLSEVTMHVEQ